MILAKIGSPLYLNLQLETGAENKYPVAILRDQDGNELTGSPYILASAGDGLYLNDSVMMPNLQVVICTYKVYNDDDHLIPSDEDADSSDVFVSDDIENRGEDTIICSFEDLDSAYLILEETSQIVCDLS
jgi:hypothetical protein